MTAAAPNASDDATRESRIQRISGYPSAQDISYIARIGDRSAYFPTDDPYVRQWFYPRYRNGKLHEPVTSKYLHERLSSDSTFLDVGAHLGYFSVIAALSARQVFSLEILEFLIPKIHRNVSANHLNNVHTLLCAAGAEPGFVTAPKVGGPDSSVSTEAMGNKVPVVRLDDYFQGENLPNIIKIDTEGYELNVLRGATEILLSKPILIIEIHEEMSVYGHNPVEIYEMLSTLDYDIKYSGHRKDAGKLSTLKKEDWNSVRNGMIFCEPK